MLAVALVHCVEERFTWLLFGLQVETLKKDE
jgi:hypothetical protein